MPNYLTKEEIRQWRSSLEKITLEEFAARLGKEVEESKPTNDVVDIVMSKGTSSTTSSNISDGFSRIAERAFERERQISHTPFSINRKELLAKNGSKSVETNEKVEAKPAKKPIKSAANTKSTDTVLDKVEEFTAKKEIQIVLKRALTDREQLVFDYLMNNVGKTVYAKDLAKLLDLPRDYVYKYIKNLRAKIEGDKLRNVPSGGFVLAE